MPDRTIVELDGTPFDLETLLFNSREVPPVYVFAYDGTQLRRVRCDANGNVFTKDTVSGLYTNQVASANTTQTQMSSQAVVGPVTISIHHQMTGTVLISDGTNPGVLLHWDATNGRHNPVAVLNVSNLDQIYYQFSVGTGSPELFYVHAGT